MALRRALASTRPYVLMCSLLVWACYSALMLRHFYKTALEVPPTQRVVRNVEELRLPRLYFCPADRRRMGHLKWLAFECILTYRDDRTTCPARLQSYEGLAPDDFHQNHPEAHGGGSPEKYSGGECLEFGTHMIGIRKEWSASWNEISLRASFNVPPTVGVANALQEMELGYMPTEWIIGHRAHTIERWYYPLLRVPLFFLDQAQHTCVATRCYIAKEVDQGLAHTGRFWYSYGAVQVAVENATLPREPLTRESADVPQVHSAETSRRTGIVHVVVSIEDFQQYEFQVSSSLYPLLAVFGQIAGLGAVLLLGPLAAVGRAARSSHTEEQASSRPVAKDISTTNGAIRNTQFSEDCEEEEEQALLSGEAPAPFADSSHEGQGGAASSQRLLAVDDPRDDL